VLKDILGRDFPYLRLSLTEACNFRCTYCLPDGYQQAGKPAFLSADEALNVVRAFAALGVTKVRLTGGEPSLRKDLPTIATKIAALGAIKTLAMTTNGYRLSQDAALWAKAGINALNISIDSLRRERFAAITGHDRLDDIVAGLKSARHAGIDRIKLNAVLMRGLNDDEFDDFIHFSADHDIPVRFIELMQTGENAALFKERHLSADHLRQTLLLKGFVQKARDFAAGPAEVFIDPKTGANIGLIAPYSKDFCTTCNRLRVTALGQLRLCLFGEFGHNLRPLLQSADQTQALQTMIIDALSHKVGGHQLAQGKTGLTPHLASIGG
jgi:cyclic pyranopterin phosphate synthase